MMWAVHYIDGWDLRSYTIFQWNAYSDGCKKNKFHRNRPNWIQWLVFKNERLLYNIVNDWWNIYNLSCAWSRVAKRRATVYIQAQTWLIKLSSDLVQRFEIRCQWSFGGFTFKLGDPSKSVKFKIFSNPPSLPRADCIRRIARFTDHKCYFSKKKKKMNQFSSKRRIAHSDFRTATSFWQCMRLW